MKKGNKEKLGSYKICLIWGVPLVKDTQLHGLVSIRSDFDLRDC